MTPGGKQGVWGPQWGPGAGPRHNNQSTASCLAKMDTGGQFGCSARLGEVRRCSHGVVAEKGAVSHCVCAVDMKEGWPLVVGE